MLYIEQIHDKCLLEQEVSNMLEIIHIYKRKVSFRTSDEKMLKIVHTQTYLLEGSSSVLYRVSGYSYYGCHVYIKGTSSLVARFVYDGIHQKLCQWTTVPLKRKLLLLVYLVNQLYNNHFLWYDINFFKGYNAYFPHEYYYVWRPKFQLYYLYQIRLGQ